MADATIVVGVIRDALKQMALALAYPSEQRDLQPHIKAVLEESLRRAFPQASPRITISVGGTGKTNLKLLGTSCWPDVEVADGATRLVAVEAKRIRAGDSSSKAIAEAIGQAIIYSIRYPHVFTFVVHYGRSDDRLHDEDVALEKRLSSTNVELSCGASSFMSRLEPHECNALSNFAVHRSGARVARSGR